MTDRPEHRGDRGDRENSDDAELRALLEDAVSDVEPTHALHDIQNRTKVTTMSSKRPWIYAAIGAVAATAATVVGVTVLSGDDTTTTAGPAASPSASATDGGTPSEEPSPDASPTDGAGADESPSPGSTTTVAVPVYFVADQPAGPRLFREFHRLPKDDVAAGQVADALRAAMEGAALDPDYRSDWPADATVTGVTVDGTAADDVVWIDLHGDVHDRPGGLTEDEAAMALEQLIYTTQAVLQQRQPVQFLIDGERTDTVLGQPTSEPLAEGAPMAVQGTVWVISPQDGDTVPSTFTVSGRGAFFEANVSWQLLRNGQVVQDGYTTAKEGMTLSPYSFEVTADPGDYVVRVYDADMSGGEGNGEAEDTKRITVK